jgi:hypothetical protein
MNMKTDTKTNTDMDMEIDMYLSNSVLKPVFIFMFISEFCHAYFNKDNFQDRKT